MIIAVMLVLTAVFFYLLLRGASRERDWDREDQEQQEYLREYNRRKAQRKTKRQQSN